MNPTWEFLIRFLKIKNEEDGKDLFSNWEQGRENVRKVLENLKLPDGFTFSPFDHEIIIDYLVKKLLGLELDVDIKEIDENVFKFDPQFLADRSKAEDSSNGCFFTHKKSGLTEMTTENGYWKLITEDEDIKFMCYVIGFKNTYHFYQGKPPSGIETKWVIREYKFNSTIIPRHFLPEHIKQKMNTHVVCRVSLEIEDPEPTSDEVFVLANLEDL